MKRILFIDITCPKPYDFETLKNQALGGTEATLLRVARELGKSSECIVAQHNREEKTLLTNNVAFYPLKPELFKEKWHAIIILRMAYPCVFISEACKGTPVFLWLHDLAGTEEIRFAQELEKRGVHLICVSDYHKGQVIDRLKTGTLKLPQVSRIYNLIPEDLDVKPFDHYKHGHRLTFFSSPHKGLNWTLKCFEALKRMDFNFKLYYANPGYYPSYEVDMRGVINMGSLTHKEVLEEVRHSLCVFYPNHVFPETFGLVMAEANAMGVPVLAHPFGAAREVLDKPKEQLMDTRDIASVVNRVLSWHAGSRPEVKGKDAFRPSQVVPEWRKLLAL